MLQSEFKTLTGVDLSVAEYKEVEHIYDSVQMNKDEFCKLWLKNRDNKIISELMDTISTLEKTNGVLNERIKTITQHHSDFGAMILSNIKSEDSMYSLVIEEYGLKYVCEWKLANRIALNTIESEYVINLLKTI